MADDHWTVTSAPERTGTSDQASARANTGEEQSDVGAAELLEESEAQLRRALADLDNLRKRYQREVERERTDERERVAREWLAVVDNLERALAHVDDTQEAERAIATGVRAVYDQALSLLAQLGFARFDDVGQPFDPHRHEAVATVAADAEPGTVVASVRPGYGNGEMVLRPAAVVVAKRG
jgi:molecular chaperone GrpE